MLKLTWKWTQECLPQKVFSFKLAHHFLNTMLYFWISQGVMGEDEIFDMIEPIVL